MTNQKFKCPECGEECIGGHRLRKHMLGAHFKNKSFEYKIEKINSYDGHIRIIFGDYLHSTDNSSTFICPVCNELCTDLNRLRIHLFAIHFNEDSFEVIQEKLKKLDEPIREYLRCSFTDIDPTESSLMDELLITDDQDCSISKNEEEEFSINDFIKKDNPICREERQFSLFLYNKLKEKKKYILDTLGIQGNIINVFYEATFMRDYWYENKIIFNEKLVEFIQENENYHNSCIIGDDKKKHVNYWSRSHPLARWMMNAKPDIAIITEYNNNYKLFFIECKYCSDTSNYKSETLIMNQVDVQEKILDFLCSKLRLKYKVGNRKNVIEKGGVILAQFVSEKCSRGEEPKININELIE